MRREGLYAIISESRMERLLQWYTMLMWLVVLLGPAVYFSLANNALNGLMVILLGSLALFLSSTLVGTILAAVFILGFRSERKLTLGAVSTAVVTFWIAILPLWIATRLRMYSGSGLVSIWYVALYTAIMLIIHVVTVQEHRIYLFLELVSSLFSAFWRSVTLLLVLIPVLLVVVALSVFSQELWQAVGSIATSRLVGSSFWLVLPALVLVLASLRREASAIIGQFPDVRQIVENCENTPFIRSSLDNGLISQEEWDRLKNQLEWRNAPRLAAELLPVLRNKVKRWLALLFVLTSVTLLFSFFAYFCVFFSVLLEPSLVEVWTGIKLDTLIVPIDFFGYTWEVGLPTTTIAVAKVSLVLAVFLASMSSVYALTDATIREVFTEWLRQKASSWLAVSAVYLCAVSPNYQIWEYLVRDKNKGIANVSIVVPRGLSEKLVQEACEHMKSRLEWYRRLVIVTAFEENPERPFYKLGMPGNRWRLLNNKVKGKEVFETIPLVLDEVRYQHFLGRHSLREGVEVPDEWFGNTPEGIALAKAVWEADTDHEWVLHPYTFESNVILSVEISLAKRKAKSTQYRQYVRELLTLTRQMLPGAQNIFVELAFRDTVEMLARLSWSKQLSYVAYKDELIDETRIEKLSAWN